MNLTKLVQQEGAETRQHMTHEIARLEQIHSDDKYLQDVKSSLFFPEIYLRQEHIEHEFDGFEDSCDWIFDDSPRSPLRSDNPFLDEPEPRWDSFSDWLRSGTGVYWISGKAGSGKSTLMSHICIAENLEKRNAMLQSWAGEKYLLTPTFYFWNAGSPLQKQVDGLLRSLIYQMICESRGLISCFEVYVPRRTRQALWLTSRSTNLFLPGLESDYSTPSRS